MKALSCTLCRFWDGRDRECALTARYLGDDLYRAETCTMFERRANWEPWQRRGKHDGRPGGASKG